MASVSMKLDVANMFEDKVDARHGLARSDVDAYADRIARHTEQIEERRGGDIGFMELPYNSELAGGIKAKAEELRSWCRNFVVLGIGGSALGNIAVHRALNHPFHNLLPDGHAARLGAPRIFVLDNVDPHFLRGFLDLVSSELSETVFNAITKSGSTAETMSQFLFFRDLLRSAPGADPTRQILVTTAADTEKSPLAGIAEQEGYDRLPIPENVAGRFSVLSAVGLLSAAVGGIDIDRMLAGAAAMDSRCRTPSVWDNPAALYASLLYLHYKADKPITVLMPYSDSLRSLTDWYCQLWAESLGKRDTFLERDAFTGPTPIGAVGVSDQHSTMQLYQDGRFDKVVTFLEVENPEPEQLDICRGESEENLAYLARHSFNELFASELKATRCALTEKQRPNCTISIPAVSPASLGELFMFFEYAVTYSGCLFGVNTFDQPSVDLAKQYTYGILGREGYNPPAGL